MRLSGRLRRICKGFRLRTELGIASSAAPWPLTTEPYELAVQSWRNSVLREVLDELFWKAQKPGLERVRFPRGAEKKRRARINALLRSCDKHSSPDLIDRESLAEEAFVRIHGCVPLSRNRRSGILAKNQHLTLLARSFCVPRHPSRTNRLNRIN